MTQEELNAVLAAHKLWMDNDGANGVYADLRRADLHGANLSGADLRCADLRSANLSDTDLIDAALGCADLRGAALYGADLIDADLRCAKLSDAKLSDADLSGASLGGADLRGADLSGAKGLLLAADYMCAHFERTPDGYIAYKIFDGEYAVPESWNLESGSVITENVNFDRTSECGCGINVAPLEWVKENSGRETRDIWRVLLRWEWLCGVCVPYNTDGEIRCERVELVEKVYGLEM